MRNVRGAMQLTPSLSDGTRDFPILRALTRNRVAARLANERVWQTVYL
jgi:hypothetical protein